MVLVSSVAVIMGGFQFKVFQTIGTSNSSKSPELNSNEAKKSSAIENIKMINETNNTFLEYKIYDNDIKFLFGTIEFSEKTNAAYEINNLPIMISLPIKPQKKLFVVESLISPNADSETKSGIMYRGYWIKNNKLLKCDVWLPAKKYIVSKKDFTVQQIYFYENFMLVFINGICCQVNQYDQNLDGANVALLINKYIFQKISSRSIEEVPEIILKEIENRKKLEKTIQNEWVIDGKNLHIND